MDAPLALERSRPKVSMAFAAPSHVGSEARVTGTDFVGTFGSSDSAYSITSFVLNARNSALFPRLSEIAGVWRRFYFKKLRFHLYGITAATQSGYTAMSSLITDDLATLQTPTTEAQILNQENVALGRPWSFIFHDVNLGGLGLDWYTTDVSQSSSEFGEAIGRAFLGLPQTTTPSDILVQVYVEYDCEFCQRIAASLVPEGLIGGRAVALTGVTNANLLGTLASVDQQSQGYTVNSAGVVTFTRGGDVTMFFNITGTTLVPFTVPALWTDMGRNGSAGFQVGAIRKTVTAGESVGPITMPSGSPSNTNVFISRYPAGSFA